MKCAHLLLAAICFAVGSLPASAESHRATRLGNPATRFAPPLQTPGDLRSLFSQERYRYDMALILRQWGWTGKLEDLFQAAATAEIEDIKIPVGTTMPFMSSRKHYEPICLRNVLWAGDEPAPAYAFNFSSNGRRYRCITPKACSNFFVQDLGPEPKSVLTLDCVAPAEILAGRPAKICLILRQIGDLPDPAATVKLSLPENVTVTSITGGGENAEGRVTWEIHDLAPGGTSELCAVLAPLQPGSFSFSADASGTSAPPIQTTCATKVFGVPAILLEVVDLEDPIEVGNEVTYEIKVTNQGSATATNVRLVCTLPESQEFVAGSGSSEVSGQDRIITLGSLQTLGVKDTAVWRVVVKAAQAADARFKVELTSDQFQRPITEHEATQQY